MSSKEKTVWLVKALILLLPLFFWPFPVKFELAKVALFLFFGFLLIIFLLKEIWQGIIKDYFQKIDKIYFSWLTVLLLSTLINADFTHLLAGGYRQQGVIFFFLLGVFVLVLKKLEKKELKSISGIISLTIIIQSLIIYGQWLAIKLGAPLLSYNQRPIGTLGEPNALAGFLLLGLPLVSQLPAILLVVGAIILTGSKGAVIALFGELIVFLFLKRKKRFKKIFLIIPLLFLILIGIFGVYQERKESVFENRWQIWSLGIKAVKKRPVLGYGAEGIVKVYEQEYRQINQPLEGVIVDRSHNLLLDIALFSGLLGLAFFLSWFWQLIKKIAKEQEWTLIPLIGFLIFSFFQPIGVTHWFYLIVLSCSSHPLITAKGESSTRISTKSS